MFFPQYCSIYNDDLLVGLEKLGYGCFIDKLFYGVLAYVDDIILIASSVSALWVMLDFCEKYAVMHNIKFIYRSVRGLAVIITV